LFGDTFERVCADYIDPVSDKSLIENAFNGMLTALDPHSGYMSAAAYHEMQVQGAGEFGGLGVEVALDDVGDTVSPQPGAQTVAHRVIRRQRQFDRGAWSNRRAGEGEIRHPRPRDGPDGRALHRVLGTDTAKRHSNDRAGRGLLR
jgi:hypothetical protein